MDNTRRHFIFGDGYNSISVLPYSQPGKLLSSFHSVAPLPVRVVSTGGAICYINLRVRRSFSCARDLTLDLPYTGHHTNLVMPFSVMLFPMVLFLQKEIFEHAVCSEGYRCNLEAWEQVSEALFSREFPFVAPCLTAKLPDQH